MSLDSQTSLEDLIARIFYYFAAAAGIVVAGAAAYLRDFSFIFPVYVVLAHLSLGVFVYSKGSRSRINISFSMMTVLIALWTFSVFMYTRAAGVGDAVLWSRTAAAIASLIPVFWLYFTIVFPKEEVIPKRGWVLAWLALGVFFFFLCFTSLIVEGGVASPSGFQFSPGNGLVFFMLHFIGFTSYGFWVLIKKHNRFTGISRMQIRYVFLGFFLGSAFPVVTNIILPVIGVVQFSGYGPFSMIIAIAFVSYAIVKHRLMSIELVVQRGLIYGIITGFIVSMYAVAILLSERFFREAVGYSSFVITGIAAVVIAILYQPFLRFLQDTTDRVFFRRHYDYQKTLKEASSAIASLIRLEQLTKLIVSTFTESMMVSEISFLLHDRARERYKSAAVELEGASRYRRMEIDERSPIISYLRSSGEILIEDELERGKAVADKDTLRELREEISRIGVPLWVPIISKEELVGVIASGNKLSGDVFSAEDLGLLSTLANQTAVALDNVRLYEEIVSMKTYNEDILQSMTNGVLTTDLKGKVITFNAMAEKITGLTSPRVIHRYVADIWQEGVIPSVVEGTLRGGYYSNYEANLLRADGSVMPISVSTTLLKDSRGKRQGVLAVLTDLSEVKELEGKVRQADKLAALGTMAAGMAHEIKNPLSSMKVLSQLLPIKFADESFRARFTEIMPREIGRIDRIVESLLGFARATAPKLKPVQVVDVLNEAISYHEDDMRQRGVKLEKEISEVPEVVADPGQLLQVFSNLILNAVQAMPEGGSLRVAVGEGKRRGGMLETIKIVISDTGHGIPKEYLKKLFDPFFTTKHGGTGLGLTISHSIIDGHGGSIAVNSDRDKGTTFTISLPVAQ